MGTTLRLNRDAATALLKEARRDFENGAQELWGMNDRTQHPVIEATVEVIGRLGGLLDPPHRWPQGDPNPGYLPEQVYLLHVLQTLTGQRDAEEVAA
jgi:hypothetical protein